MAFSASPSLAAATLTSKPSAQRRLHSVSRKPASSECVKTPQVDRPPRPRLRRPIGRLLPGARARPPPLHPRRPGPQPGLPSSQRIGSAYAQLGPRGSGSRPACRELGRPDERHNGRRQVQCVRRRGSRASASSSLLPANWLAPCFVKLRMISAEIAPHSISTKRGLTAPRRNASRRGISYYSRYEKQTYSLRLCLHFSTKWRV